MMRQELDAASDWANGSASRMSVQSSGMRNGGMMGHGMNGVAEELEPLRGGGGDDHDTGSISTMETERGLRAQPDMAQRAMGRMCFGVSLPGTGHTEYVFQISGAGGKSWKVARRYSEFLDLDNKLRQMFGRPTRPFPPLPEKKLIGSTSSEVVEKRQPMLAAYLQAVLENSILSSTAEVQRFIDAEADSVPPTPSVFRSNVPRPMQ
uniref:PX domain-containing protein n=1 Tax=Hemiselmis andersenii TaxID=464988 RepID=A0A6T8L672_HEMAN|mmetsp:Transcript_25875/g.62779  ORF Transcript_25875/g.62779 Transcript_25875/m.62779 type:complete len:207 (-) Transcript_25875:70-690(-)